MYGQRMLPPAVPAYLAQMGGNFTLKSATGTVHLSDFRGKVGLLYFGYSHCPDVCPAALSVMAQAMRQIPQTQAGRIYGLFVSVDPRRDTPSYLQRYVSFFDARMVGATGTPAQLSALAGDWKMDFSVPDVSADSHYSVSHSNFIYLINAQGQVVALFDEKTLPDEMALWMRRWLER
jgi:protein SCO1/2